MSGGEGATEIARRVGSGEATAASVTNEHLARAAAAADLNLFTRLEPSHAEIASISPDQPILQSRCQHSATNRQGG